MADIKKIYSFAFSLLFSLSITAQSEILLYDKEIPNSTGYQMEEIPVVINGQTVGYRNISCPSLSVYHPCGKSNNAAVIICPGGGYFFENSGPEGKAVAETLTEHGFTAFVLKYRLPSDSIMLNKSIGPLQDAQQAIKMVRENAKKWHIDPKKIGIMGFSAGGHVASTAATHFDKGLIPNKSKTSLRPDFTVLIYPVISFKEPLAHRGSKNLLLGTTFTQDQSDFFSNELYVNAATPPTWITHAGDDELVPVENSILFYDALIKNKVPAELYVCPSGNHGFVLTKPAEEWMYPLFKWITKINSHKIQPYDNGAYSRNTAFVPKKVQKKNNDHPGPRDQQPHKLY